MWIHLNQELLVGQIHLMN